MEPFHGTVALITGAARGIGQTTALKFAAEGADLALCDLNAEWLEETAEKAKGFGHRVECYSVDVSDSDGVSITVKEIEKRFAQIDILVNNAGITKDGLLLRMSEEDWDVVLNVNLKGVFLFTKAVMRGMMKRRCGRIVNIASIIGLIGNPGQANYSASKGAVISFTKTVAKELASRNIRCNAVAPGFIRTKMTEALSEEAQKKMLANIPLGRFGDPEDVANVVAFLAGDASSYLTGQVISACGGMVM